MVNKNNIIIIILILSLIIFIRMILVIFPAQYDVYCKEKFGKEYKFVTQSWQVGEGCYSNNNYYIINNNEYYKICDKPEIWELNKWKVNCNETQKTR